MKKSEIIWLIIRLIGLYFAYLAISNLISLVIALFALIQQPLYQREFIILLQPFIQITLFLIAAYYLLDNGKYLFVILNRGNSKNSLIDDLKIESDQPKDKQNPH